MSELSQQYMKQCPYCDSEQECLTLVPNNIKDLETGEIGEACSIRCTICGMIGPSAEYLGLAIEEWNHLPRKGE